MMIHTRSRFHTHYRRVTHTERERERDGRRDWFIVAKTRCACRRTRVKVSEATTFYHQRGDLLPG